MLVTAVHLGRRARRSFKGANWCRGPMHVLGRNTPPTRNDVIQVPTARTPKGKQMFQILSTRSSASFWNVECPNIVSAHHLDPGRRRRRQREVLGTDNDFAARRQRPSLYLNVATNRLARSARELASSASYAEALLSHTEIVSSGPERYSELGKAETS